MRFSVHLLAAGLLLAGPLAAAKPADALRAALERDDPALDVRGGAVPGTVLAAGPRATPLVLGLAAGIPAPVAAATTVGRGRVVAIGHTAFLEGKAMAEVPGNAVFLDHALRWLAGGKPPARIWLDDRLKGLKDPLGSDARKVEFVSVPDGLTALPKAAVVVLAPDWHPLAAMPAVRAFLMRGGAALCPVVGWGWHQVSGGKSFRTESPFNALLATDGLSTDGRCQARPSDRGFEVRPAFDPVLDFLGQWYADPTRAWPARPEAAAYPGLPPPKSARMTRTVPVDLSVPRWHGTGLFAAAGEKLTVQLPPGAEKKGLKLRIGATTCRLSGKKLKRPPVVDLEVPLETRTVSLASPFGGPVFLVVPKGLSGRIDVKVGPACPMPTYTLGRTSAEAWLKRRTLPAPMAELATDKVVLTVPSAVVRDLDDPAPLLKTWDRIMDLDAKLTAIPAVRESPERFCCDVQLCAGYMHAGYPIMIPMDSAKRLTNLDQILRGEGDVWGLFHEMGHNHQNRDWTFDGTGEVTVNFFTLYCLRHICGQTSRQTRMGDARLAEKVRQWNDAGRPLDEWKRDPFLALDFFVRLEEKYGWAAFEKLFAEYRALKPSERPKTDLDKRRQWCERLSRIVGEDLSAEFAFLLHD